MVMVNSTSATFALAGGVPVKALGTAVYAMPGITDHGLLSDFWTSPTPPDPQLYDAFCRVLHKRCLVRRAGQPVSHAHPGGKRGGAPAGRLAPRPL
jgi:capsular polysaccharide export protein